jgi:hypothetical protein
VTVDLTLHLCPDPWEVPGISTPQGYAPLQTSSDDDLGTTEVALRLLPDGPPGPRMELDLSLIGLGQNELSCLMCKAMKPKDVRAEAEGKLVSIINDERAARPDCTLCEPLGWDYRLRSASLGMLGHLIGGQSLKYPEYYLQGAGVSWFRWGAMNGFVPKTYGQGVALKDEELRAIVAGWLSEGPEAGWLMDGRMLRIGAAAGWTNGPPSGWHIVVFVADGEEQTAEIPEFTGGLPALPCGYSCIRKLQYFRRVETTGGANPGTVLSDYITFKWRTPEVCNLWKVQLGGDVRGVRATWLCGTGPGDQCTGEIPPTKSLAPILGGKEMEFEMRDIPPYPGELFTVWGWLHGMGTNPCNPVLLVAGYYSHFCYTSGEIQAIRLYENGTVLDEITEGETPAGWVGDTRLAYLVNCEGTPITVKPTDFAGYQIGERVVIHKGGTHNMRQAGGGFQKEAGCQDPEGGTPYDLLRWDLVRPFPDLRDGEIVPARFWGI